MGNNWMINVQKLFSFLGKLQRIIGQGWGCRVQCRLTPIYSIYHPARENCAKTCDWSDALSKEALCLIKFCDCGSFLRSCLVPGKKPQVIDKSISYFGSCVVEYDEHYGAELRQTYRFLKTTLPLLPQWLHIYSYSYPPVARYIANRGWFILMVLLLRNGIFEKYRNLLST